MISIRQIEVIRSVLLARSISGAARLLNVSPAAVSRMLRHAESLIGYPLFERTREGFIPTPEAHDLLDDLEEVHKRLGRIEARLTYANSDPDVLRIGSSPGLGLSLIPSALAEMVRLDPSFQFQLGALHIDEILSHLEFGRYDFAMTIYDLDDPRLKIRSLAKASMICLVAQDHPLAQRQVVTIEEAAEFDFVGYDPQSFQQQMIDRLFTERGLAPRYKGRCRLMNTACSLVKERIGITFLDAFTTFGEPPSGTKVIELGLDDLFPLNLVTLANAPTSQETERFIDVLMTVVTGNAKRQVGIRR